MDLFANLALGSPTVFSVQNPIYAFTGRMLDTLIGVLPDLGPTVTIATLLPTTYTLLPVATFIMLAGTYYGAQYDSSITTVLVNPSGGSPSVATTIDGHQMTRRGRAGVTLATMGLGSLFAGCVATLVLAASATPLSEFAFNFGPAGYFSLMMLGLIGVVIPASGSLAEATVMIVLDLLLGLVDTDVSLGTARYSPSVPELAGGLNFVSVAMGVFGFTEIITNLKQKEHRETFVEHVRNLWPGREDLKHMILAILRGTALGSLLGILSGGGATLASPASYSPEEKTPKYSSKFGKGAIGDVTGPESANNAATQTPFISLLTLGIPPNAAMALMVGAMTIHNIQPGPQVMTSNPALFWGLIASMWIGNLVLIVLNLSAIGVQVRLLKVSHHSLYSAILVFCCIGVYSVSDTTFGVLQTVLFGLIGYMFIKPCCESAPILFGFVLGLMMEESFRRTLLPLHGDFSTLVMRPLSMRLLIAVGIPILLVALPIINRKRMEVFQEE